MKKYVLNIEKLYSGQTSNAMLLKQVDEDFPILIPSVDKTIDLYSFIDKWRKVYDFNPPSYDIDELNDYIIDFNLLLQQKYKDKGHPELYMMDDTNSMRPVERTRQIDKRFLHGLNGRSSVVETNLNGDEVKVDINSSQVNVIFPWRKISTKSLYQTEINTYDSSEIDRILELSKDITLQGKVTYEKCLQSVSNVGNNMYMMSPNIDIGPDGLIYGNGLTVINGYGTPWYFPHSMTLFQPSQENYANIDDLVEQFVEWYQKHDYKTIVSLSDVPGGNVTQMKINGSGSYELVLADQSPTNIVVLGNEHEDSKKWTWIDLKLDNLRDIRDGRYEHHFYDRKLHKYVIDNKYKNTCSKNVGLMFNLYDTFISGKDRILRLDVPVDKDFNDLYLSFEIINNLDEYLNNNNIQYSIDINQVQENQVISTTPIYDSSKGGVIYQGFEDNGFHISDTTTKSYTFDIVVRIHYQVDYQKRMIDEQYANALKNSGVVLNNIRIENKIIHIPEHLTWGAYINEYGITQEEHASRYEQFWKVSRFIKNISYQTVIESSLNNIVSNRIEFNNNYSTGDMYGDVFVTKSVLNSKYDMELIDSNEYLIGVGRDYIGLCGCSNQLSLIYNQTRLKMQIVDNEDDVQIKRDNNNELKYQRVETVKNINKFESSIKHKLNVFSIGVDNSNLSENTNINQNNDSEVKLELYKKKLRESVVQFVRDTCSNIAPVHTQLFDVQFT